MPSPRHPSLETRGRNGAVSPLGPGAGAGAGRCAGGLDLLDTVGVDEEGEGGAVGPGGPLDHVGDVALFGLLVERLSFSL